MTTNRWAYYAPTEDQDGPVVELDSPASVVGRARVVPFVDPESLTVEIAGTTVHLNSLQFQTFLALRPLTPIPAHDLGLLLHLPVRYRSDAARQRIYSLRRALRLATGRNDLIEWLQFGYRLTVAS